MCNFFSLFVTILGTLFSILVFIRMIAPFHIVFATPEHEHVIYISVLVSVSVCCALEQANLLFDKFELSSSSAAAVAAADTVELEDLLTLLEEKKKKQELVWAEPVTEINDNSHGFYSSHW